MCYDERMTTTGLRELRQQASDLVRKAKAGETIIVTVNGRAVAQLGPVRRHRWRRADDLAAAVAAAGRQPRARIADLLIAATARTHEAELWTRNPNDLIGLDSLITIRALTG